MLDGVFLLVVWFLVDLGQLAGLGLDLGVYGFRVLGTQTKVNSH